MSKTAPFLAVHGGAGAADADTGRPGPAAAASLLEAEAALGMAADILGRTDGPAAPARALPLGLQARCLRAGVGSDNRTGSRCVLLHACSCRRTSLPHAIEIRAGCLQLPAEHLAVRRFLAQAPTKARQYCQLFAEALQIAAGEDHGASDSLSRTWAQSRTLRRSGVCTPRSSQKVVSRFACTVDHTGSADGRLWRELSTAEQQAAGALGWAPVGWDAGDWTDSHDRPWAELPSADRRAADCLGYTAASWDAIVLDGAEGESGECGLEPGGSQGRPQSAAEQEGLARLVSVAVQELLAISVELAEEEAEAEAEAEAAATAGQGGEQTTAAGRRRWWALLRPVVEVCHRAACTVHGPLSQQASRTLGLRAQVAEALALADGDGGGGESESECGEHLLAVALRLQEELATTDWVDSPVGARQASQRAGWVLRYSHAS
eukprot:SAG22_NODE_1276_length_4918_cov_1.532061_2_plen_435_part_00